MAYCQSCADLQTKLTAAERERDAGKQLVDEICIAAGGTDGRRIVDVVRDLRARCEELTKEQFEYTTVINDLSKELGDAGILITESVSDGVVKLINQRDDFKARCETLEFGIADFGGLHVQCQKGERLR